jgi:hypothetical protein
MKIFKILTKNFSTNINKYKEIAKKVEVSTGKLPKDDYFERPKLPSVKFLYN